MFFLIQKENTYNSLDIDILTLKEELDKNKYQHTYLFLSMEDLKEHQNISSKIDLKEAIPIGSLQFVQTYLSNIHHVDKMNPIEIPNELRFAEFIGRKYSIIDKHELLTKNGYYFVKYASKLKYFSHVGLLDQLKYEDVGKEPFLKEGLYVFSEVKDILSEYRVFVHNDKVERIQYYDGDPMIMPTIDELNKIQKMVLLYTRNAKRPKSYSLDVAIVKENNYTGRNLIILEIHAFLSIGLYGANGSFLPYAYRNGIDYYIQHNLPLEKFSNFN